MAGSGLARTDVFNGLSHDIGDRLIDVDHAPRFILSQRLERRELRVEQAGRHEMTTPALDSSGQHVATAVQVDELSVRRVIENRLPIGPAKSGAGDDHARSAFP